MPKPLDGIKVIEFGNFIAGPFCGMLLADMGAEVIKIEPISGDMSRAIPPLKDGVSSAFMALNRNKKSVVLDLKSQQGKSIAEKLIKETHALIENNRPGVMERLGLGIDDVKKINNKIVYTSVSGFGQTGPLRNRAGVNLIIEALSGTLSVMGEEGEIPPRPGLQTADILGAMFATYATLSGLIGQLKNGEGKYSDVALMEASIASAVWETTEYLSTGVIPKQLGHSHRASAPYQLFKTIDKKFIAIGAPNDAHFKKLMDVLDCSSFSVDIRFKTYASRKENEEYLVPLVAEKISNWNSIKLEEILTENGIPCGCVRNYAEALNDKHSSERGVVIEKEDPELGKIKMIRNPVRMDNDGPTINSLAPALGQHTFDILKNIGINEKEYHRLISEGVTL
ncbi:MAG: CoA transferase [Hyphomicrobiales bacterium]|nr:CoA transferase [Hyphomicrobiales bacterium]